MKNNYKIDIIMGIYNCENYLEKSINSLINQSFDSWRLILCDDGSTDKTYNVAKKYASKYKDKIILLKNRKNMGLNYTLNKCLEQAKSKYIARQDGDDYSDPNRLQEQYYFLENNKQYDFVSSGINLFDEKGIWGKIILKEEPKYEDFVKGSPFCHASVMIKRESLIKVGGYSLDKNTHRVEDYDLWINLYLAGFKGYNMQKVLYYACDDLAAIKRKNYRNRINEVKVKLKALKSFNLPLFNIIYIFKPILLIIFPTFLYKLFRKNKLKNR